MPDAPPAIIFIMPDVPPGFDIRNVVPAGDAAPLNCPPSENGEIVLCGHRSAAPHRVMVWLPPPPAAMDEINAALMVRVGPVEIRPSGIKIRF